MCKALIVWVSAFLLVLFSTAESLPDYEPPYGERLNPKPFQYEYSLQSQESGAAFSKKEIQDEEGNVVGEVVVALPDGRVQTTNYNADFYEGYNADIKYAGTASYPHEHRHQTYNAPKFIPVHLKSKPRTPTHKSRPKKPQRNLYNAHSPPSRSRYTNSQYRRKPTLQPELNSIENIEIDIIESTQPSNIAFESEKIESLNSPGEFAKTDLGRKIREKLPSLSVGESKSMAELMAEGRENLTNIKKGKESEKLRLIPKQPKQTRPLAPRKPDKMVRIPDKNKKDSNNSGDKVSRVPFLNPQTPPRMVIKSHIMSEPRHKNIEQNKQNERIKEGKVTNKKQSFKNRPLSPSKPDKMINIMKNSVKDNDDAKTFRSPSLNPETPPRMFIKSHLMSGPKHTKMNENRNEDSTEGSEMMKIKSNVKKAMAIKSHVISAPRPAESMEIIMKKIKEDTMKKKDSDQVTLPAPVLQFKSPQKSEVSSNKLILGSQVPPVISRSPTKPETPEIMKVVSHVMEDSADHSTTDPLRDSVADFMKKVELMKRRQKKTNESIVSVQPRVIEQSDTEDERKVPKMLLFHDISNSPRLEAPSKEESSNSVRY